MKENHSRNNNQQAIFYDAGLTLIGPSLTIQEVSVLICDRFGISADLQAVRRALSLAEEKFIQAQMEDRHVWASEASIRRMWTDYYSFALHQSGIEAPPEVVRACAAAIYDEYGKPEYWQVFPDAETTLVEGKRRGYVQGVISDWGTELQQILHTLDLTRYLDFVVVSSVVGIAKPNPRVFELAMARGGVQTHQAIHVGDSYHTDVMGARGAGITPVLIDREGRHKNMDCTVVRSLEEILDLLEVKEGDACIAPAT